MHSNNYKGEHSASQMDVDHTTSHQIYDERDNSDTGSIINANDQANIKGQTAKEMDKLAEKWMTYCVRAVSLPTMLEIVEPIVPNMTDDIKEIHSQGEDYMITEFKRLSKSIFEEKNLVEKQNKLDRLKKEAESRKRVEAQLIPTPYQVTKGLLHRTKKQELLRLEKVLENITKENFDIMNQIQFADEERKKKQAKLESILKELEKNASTADALSQEEMMETMYKLQITPFDE